MGPEPFHVGNESAGRVTAEVDTGIVGKRPATPAHTLVEQDDPVASWVKSAAVTRGAARAGASVDNQRRFAGRVAAGLPVHEVRIPHVQHPRLVRLDRGVRLFHRR